MDESTRSRGEKILCLFRTRRNGAEFNTPLRASQDQDGDGCSEKGVPWVLEYT